MKVIYITMEREPLYSFLRTSNPQPSPSSSVCPSSETNVGWWCFKDLSLSWQYDHLVTCMKMVGERYNHWSIYNSNLQLEKLNSLVFFFLFFLSLQVLSMVIWRKMGPFHLEWLDWNCLLPWGFVSLFFCFVWLLHWPQVSLNYHGSRTELEPDALGLFIVRKVLWHLLYNWHLF